MSITVIDYGSGNLKSAAKALEVAANNINLSSKIIVTSDPKMIEQSDKVILPGQGSFRDCFLGINKIPGLHETLNDANKEEFEQQIQTPEGLKKMIEFAIKLAGE